jgi:hypothetical protein
VNCVKTGRTVKMVIDLIPEGNQVSVGNWNTVKVGNPERLRKFERLRIDLE